MDPTPWMRPASSGVTLGDAPPTNREGQPCRKYSMRGMTVALHQLWD